MTSRIANKIADSARDLPALHAALADADSVPALLSYVQLSGDFEILRRAGTYITGGFVYRENLPEALKREIWQKLAAIIRDLAAGNRAIPDISDTAFASMMSTAVGQRIERHYVPLVKQEMGLDPVFGVAAARSNVRPPQHVGPRVLIIGAGLGGVCAGIALQEQGFAFDIVEKNAGVGGCWYENRYPGCGVDSPNHTYSYSFDIKNDWSHHFSKRDEILNYIRDVSSRHGIEERITFGVEVTQLRFDEERNLWQVTLRDNAGTLWTSEYEVVVTAVGQLNRPAFPEIEGLGLFEGRICHTAEWPEDIDLAGRAVALVGSGASAMQVGPSIASTVGTLTVYQRSAPWVIRTDNYFNAVSSAQIWCLENIPFYSEWQRFLLFWASQDGFHDTLHADATWPFNELSMNRQNHAVRKILVDHLLTQLAGRDDLVRKCLPDYPPWGKRMLRDNGWYSMLRRANVELVGAAVTRMTRNGIVGADGVERPCEVAIFATGFRAKQFLAPMDIFGRGGRSINEAWDYDDARAYKGVATPDYPNLFFLYGPNANPGPGGSAIFNLECQVRYIVQALDFMRRTNASCLEVRRDIFNTYNEAVDARMSDMVWLHRNVSSWYVNSKGRIVTNSPWKQIEYWKMLRTFKSSEYHTVSRLDMNAA